MSTLVINTLSETDERVQKALAVLEAGRENIQVIHTQGLSIKSCIGCNACWIKTPGVCAVKDDYAQILEAFMQHDTVVYMVGTAFGFMNYQGKNVIDRILPLITMHIQIVGKEMRHVMRYDRKWKLGLLYAGEADRDYFNEWLNRFAINMVSDSMGAYPIEQAEEVASCIS